VIPERLAGRPRAGALPVPFVVPCPGGRPDFRSHDRGRRRECAEGRLCQLCGLPLPDRFVLVGFRGSVATGRFGEPPACEECMEFAWGTCPWLVGRRGWVAAEGDVAERPAAEPEVMEWAVASSYEWVDDGTGFGVWLAEAEEVRLRWRG
jgi:hypothetical protein